MSELNAPWLTAVFTNLVGCKVSGTVGLDGRLSDLMMSAAFDPVRKQQIFI